MHNVRRLGDGHQSRGTAIDRPQRLESDSNVNRSMGSRQIPWRVLRVVSEVSEH